MWLSELIDGSFSGRGRCDVDGISVPCEDLKGANEVLLKFPDAGGHVSSVVLQIIEEGE